MSEAKVKDTVVQCPMCGHTIHLDIDISVEEQDYQDECPACGESIHVRLHREVGDDRLHVKVDADDEQYY
ncbi:CPXCG motif-containing cysteine-rich protein [Aliidiomarina maris]|uniref:CPXCG motif-containing cysteine-rich protein n=1 Tax=Aliidiomarina maris TaxID=531312 RepID=A0ABY0BS61_9GAMM|nr:CPXCG motif-containing cysteine-rich protein [Aliidiomarina maris]MCL5050135.1 CPXCG motif-containing cysteine-rich protein [Bacillota bacterium]RUO24957.1 CPXCG motif-containing cysteine-rich protein [Aliidiomarina maris]